MNHVIVFHYVNITLIIMHFAIKLITIFLHVKNLCSDTFYPMILKRKWIIRNTNYYRTKIQITERSDNLYNLCIDCGRGWCIYKERDCAIVNYILVAKKSGYRYFSHASKKKKRITT